MVCFLCVWELLFMLHSMLTLYRHSSRDSISEFDSVCVRSCLKTLHHVVTYTTFVYLLSIGSRSQLCRLQWESQSMEKVGQCHSTNNWMSTLNFHRIVLPIKRSIVLQSACHSWLGNLDLYIWRQEEKRKYFVMSYFWMGFFIFAVQVLIPSIRRTIAFLRGVRIVSNI